MHAQFIVLLAAPPVPVAPGPIAASLVVGLIILNLFALVNKFLWKEDRYDDIIRVVVGSVVVAGMLSFFQPIREISRYIQKAIKVFAGAASPNVFTLITIVIVVFGVVLYYRRPSFTNLIIMAVLLVPFFTSDFMSSVESGYVEHVGVPMWNNLVSFLGWAQTSSL